MQYKSLYTMLCCATLSASSAAYSSEGDNNLLNIQEPTVMNGAVERVIDTAVKLINAKQDFEKAEDVNSKVDVVIDAATTIAPEVMKKVDHTIDKISDDKGVQEASATLDLIGEIANQFADQNGNATLQHTGGLVSNVSDLLDANTSKEAAKEIVAIVGNVDDIVKENRSFFKRYFSCCYPKVKKTSK